MSCDLRRPWLGAVVVALAWVVGCKVDALFEAGRAPDPPPPQLVFAPPPDGTAGEALSPAVQVSALDSAGNVDTSFQVAVTVTLGANPGRATLAGTRTVEAVRGVATFADLSLNKASNGYTLVATAPGARGVTSPQFDITPAAAAQLAFTPQPRGAPAGSVITPAVQVTASDALGNVVSSFTGDVTMVLGENPTGATLGGTKTVAAVEGIASFADLSINKAGRYTLTASASASGLTSATSDQFDITAGPNQPPIAAFPAPSCNFLTCSFTDQSSDPDGSIASR